MEDKIFERKKYQGLSYEMTAILKTLAILIVVVSYYFRYFAADTSLKILGSAGVFGAALFALLSGYGVTKSYIAKGIRGGYLLNKFCKVYLPFIVINILSVIFIYKEESGNRILNRLLLGSDDGVMWYIPWIFTFYVVFYVLCRFFRGDLNYIIIGICIVCVAQTLLFSCLGMGSQWYTSDGALVVGVVCALNEKRLRKTYGLILPL